MKNIKSLVAVALTVVMLCAFSTISFAAVNLDYENIIEFSATVSAEKVAPGEDITVSFFMKDSGADDSVEMLSGGSFGFDFAIDTTKFTYKSVAIGQNFTKSFATKEVGGVTYYTNLIEPSDTATVAKDQAIFTYVFTVNENVASGTYDIITGTADPYVGDGEGYEAGDYTFDFAQVTVEAADPVVDSEAIVVKSDKTEITGESGQVYSNVWIGTFKVTLGNDGVTGVKAVYNNGKTTNTYAVDGEGNVTATIAIVGAPANAVVTAELVK